MALIPEPELTTPKLIFGAVEKRARTWKSRRLGGSSIGKECERALWYQFRWASKPVDVQPDGRRQRLRETGNEQEPLLAALLREAGVELYDVQHGEEQNPRRPQINYTALGGHFVVYLDGVGRGFPEAPSKWHVVSYKLAMAKYWKAFATKGLKETNRGYYDQAQIEMHLSGIDRTIVIVRNRDTEELHAERVRYSATEADALLAKANRIIASDKPLPRINDDPDWYVCKMCDHRATCHEVSLAAPTCRTCAHSTAQRDGEARWSCAVRGVDLDPKQQLAGCGQHVYLPELLAGWARIDDATETGVIYVNDTTGHRFEQGPNGITSEQLQQLAPHFKLVGDPNIEGFKERFGATVVSVSEVAA